MIAELRIRRFGDFYAAPGCLNRNRTCSPLSSCSGVPASQVMVALSSTPRRSSRRRTRATAGSCVTEALRIACRTMCAANFTSRQLRSAASTSTDDQSPTGSKRCARYNPSSASPLHSTVRLSWRQRRRSCALIWLGTSHASAWPIGRPAAQWSGSHWAISRCQAAFDRSLACPCVRRSVTWRPSRGSCPSRSAVSVLRKIRKDDEGQSRL